MDQIADLAETLAACRGRPAFRAAFGLVGRLCTEDLKAVCTAFTGRTEASRDAALQRIWEHRTIAEGSRASAHVAPKSASFRPQPEEEDSMTKAQGTTSSKRKASSRPKAAKRNPAVAISPPPPEADQPASVMLAEALPPPQHAGPSPSARGHRFEAASVAPLIAHLRSLGVEVQAVL